MPNTPNRDAQEPGSQEQRKRQQLNDKSLEQQDDEQSDEERIEAPGEDDDATPLRTEQGGETGEDEDLPDGDTEVNRNPGNLGER